MRRVLTVISIAATGVLPLPATAQTTTHTCFGEPATVVGTSGIDNLTGDVVVGLGNGDFLHGRLVCGNSGDEYEIKGYMVNAGPGHDFDVKASGPVGIGGSGNDYMLDGSFDGQTFWGGQGDDDMVFDEDQGPGPDDIHVEPDVFYGGGGNDEASVGYLQDSRQYGQEGNDELRGGQGQDRLFGGIGDDWMQSGYATVDDKVRDVLRGGDGFDTCLVIRGDRAINCEDVTVLEPDF